MRTGPWVYPRLYFGLPADKHQQVAQEISDILIYLVRLADNLDIDLLTEAAEKLKLNAEKYPADKVRGSAKKYSEY